MASAKPKKKNPRLASGRKRVRQDIKINAANTSLRSKYRTAVDKNVKIITENEFLRLIDPTYSDADANTTVDCSEPTTIESQKVSSPIAAVNAVHGSAPVSIAPAVSASSLPLSSSASSMQAFSSFVMKKEAPVAKKAVPPPVDQDDR
jgi:ribosomal protein S20